MIRQDWSITDPVFCPEDKNEIWFLKKVYHE